MSTDLIRTVNRTRRPWPNRPAGATLSAPRRLPDRLAVRPGRFGMTAASKPEFLTRHRTFHSGHPRVTDPLFAIDGFFDPRDLLLVKYEMLRRVRVDRWSVARAARGAALSRTAWYDAMRRWERCGLVGLLPDSPGPRTRGAHPRAADCPTAHADGRQKGGPVPPGGTRGTRPGVATGSAGTSPVKGFSFCDRGCWPGCGPPRATTGPRCPTLTHHGATRRIRWPWVATWSSPLPS